MLPVSWCKWQSGLFLSTSCLFDTGVLHGAACLRHIAWLSVLRSSSRGDVTFFGGGLVHFGTEDPKTARQKGIVEIHRGPDPLLAAVDQLTSMKSSNSCQS